MSIALTIYALVGLSLSAKASTKLYMQESHKQHPNWKEYIIFFCLFWLFFILWPFVLGYHIVQFLKGKA